MPVPLRAPHHRAEAKFNVTTEFPSLGLHSAASTGNVGLVKYALSRGQPVNSVVDGVLPLHAACAGGNVQVVKLLIEYGADVNAPRLPKRYSNRDSSAPIIGSTGSTPLHFAAANGNREAIMLLLLHGAHAARPDKHGVTPEVLARQHGWIECADDLRTWIINKDKDLRDREEYVAAEDKDGGKRRNRLGSFGDLEPSHTRRRLHVKQSIDTALNMLRSSSSNLGEAYHRGTHSPTPPTSPTRPFGDYSSVLGNSNQDLFPDPSTRRPSLPHAIHSDSLARSRKPSAQLTNSRRPNSAGEGAEETSSSNNTTKSARRLGSKVSLLNLFRKGPSSEEPSTNHPAGDTSSLSNSPPTTSGSPLVQPRTRPHQDSDASIRSRTVGNPSLERKASLNSPSHSPVPMAVDLYDTLSQEQQRINNRDRSRSSASSRYDHLTDEPLVSSAGSYHSPSSSPLARLGLLRSQGHHRTRSGSGSSLGHEVNVHSRLGTASTATPDDTLTDYRVGNTGADTDNLSRSLPRSGMFRPHNRNGSSGQSHMTPSALRALSSHNQDIISLPPPPRGTPARLKSSNSVGSLVRSDSHSGQRRNVRPGSVGFMTEPKQVDGHNDGDTLIKEVEEDQEEYGKPIEATGASLLIGVAKAPSGGSLSPIISANHASGEAENALMAEFPFSINTPPPMPTEGELDEANDPTVPIIARTSNTMDNRHRGDSLSSVETSASNEPSQTSSTASTMMVATPLMSMDVAPPSDDTQEKILVSGAQVVNTGEEDQRSQYIISPATDVTASPSLPPPPPPKSPEPHRTAPPVDPYSSPTHMYTNSASRLGPPSGAYVGHRSLSGRRTRTPFDIDIASISTHAQAEALVEKAKQEVLELASQESQDSEPSTGSDGRTPLSARLAAYGESLALERRFRELERGAGSADSEVTISTPLTNGDRSGASTTTSSTNLMLQVINQHSTDGSTYSASLYSGKSTGGLRVEPPRSASSGRPRRPSTAEGLPPRDINLSLSSEQSEQSTLSNQSMRSASALGHRRTEASPYHPPIPTLNISDAEDDYQYQPSSLMSRSRTPTGDRDGDIKSRLSINRMASLDGMTYLDQNFGSDLYRVSTTPSPVTRLAPAQAQGRSAKKLSKMGISLADQVGIGALPPPANPHLGKRFGALKSFFKGKT